MTQTVSALVCHAHVEMAIECLGSMLRLCQDPIALTIHDDGSLTPADRDRLADGLSQPRIIHRKEADDLLCGLLQNYPALRDLRQQFVLALKLIDTVALAPSERYALCDSDVLWLKRFFLPSNRNNDVILMSDRRPSYSLRSWDLALASRVQLPKAANAGIIMACKRRVDWDYLEWFVSRPRHRSILPMVEQTAWAALAMRLGCRVFDNSQVRVMREGEDNANLVGGHFTARTRHLLPEFFKRSLQSVDTEPVQLRTESAGECKPLDLACYEVRRIAKRLVRSRKRAAL